MPDNHRIYKAGKIAFLLVCLFLCTACGKEKSVFQTGEEPAVTILENEPAQEETVKETEEETGESEEALLVNINTADAETLMSLPGIGEKKAAAIIEYRQQNGEFTAIEEIMNVKGIKTGIFSKINHLICVK